MKPHRRLLLSGVIAVVAIGWTIVAILSTMGNRSHVPPAPVPQIGSGEPARGAPVPTSEKGNTLPETGVKQIAAASLPSSGAPNDSKAELLIEEHLAGIEEPGAIFYMSRIREAIVEGNPKFARELLRQMKDSHPQSGLVSEAEGLFRVRGQKVGG